MKLTAWHAPAIRDSEITPRDDFEHVLFARGYLLSRTITPAPVEHWHYHRVGAWHLSRDPRLAASFVERDGRSLLLIGNVIDLRAQVDGAEVAPRLFSAWEKSRADLDDALEWLAGRYVLLGQSPESDFLQTDATGMLSASYSAEQETISSHQNLISENAGGLPFSAFGEPDWLKSNQAYTFPGTYTRFAGVHMLTANSELDLGDFSVRRVGPRATISIDPREAAIAVLELMSRQLAFLSRTGGGPLVSLTAGLDSRVTMAAMRDITPETLFFTYERHRDPGGACESRPRDCGIARRAPWVRAPRIQGQAVSEFLVTKCRDGTQHVRYSRSFRCRILSHGATDRSSSRALQPLRDRA